MKKYKWFWITFVLWCFVGAIGARALIYSSFHLPSKNISEFSVQINGIVEKNILSINSVRLSSSLEETTRQWQGEGWSCVTGNVNLSPILLNAPKGCEQLLDSLVQMRVFQKNDSIRVLSLLNDINENQTYQWVSEVPRTTIQPQDPSKVDFPLKPPSDASELLTIKTKEMEATTWTSLSGADPLEKFKKIYSSQGFSGKTFSKSFGETTFLLVRGSTRLLAVFSQDSKKNTISVVKLNKT